jgi:hypothetical protein
MALYNNHEGWQPSPKTLKLWRFIPMKDSTDAGFNIPPMFKDVDPIIRVLVMGFIGLIALECYATFAVAMHEGVPIEIIAILILVDIFLATLPHLSDDEITDLKVFKFIGENCETYLNLETDEIAIYKANKINNEYKLAKCIRKRKWLYLPIIFSTLVKLYLFFSVYTFYDTYQAYIVLISYSLGCILHILCTGYVIMYARFLISLRKDRKIFGSSNGHTNRKKKDNQDKLINLKSSSTKLNFNAPQKDNLKIKLSSENKYYIQFEGIMTDEDINDLISNQDSLLQSFPIALTGKIIQNNLLKRGTQINPNLNYDEKK